MRELTSKGNLQAVTQDSSFEGGELVQDENDKINAKCEDIISQNNDVSTNDDESTNYNKNPCNEKKKCQ